MNKKLLIIGCIAALSISMTACGSNSSSSSNTDSSTSSTVIPDKSATDESTTEENVSATSDEEVDTTSAKDVMNKIIATVSENRNCAMTAEASMSAKFKMTINGSSMDQDMSSTVNVDAKSTNKGIYSKTKEVMNNSNDGTSKTTEKESYMVSDSKTTYTSEDGGKTWIENAGGEDFSKLLDMNNIFADDSAFDDATISTEDDKFIIDVDLSKVQSLTEGLSKNFDDGAGFTGILEIVADKDYYPISIEMKDIKFDTDSMEKSMKAMTANSDDSSEESVDADVDIDLNLAFKANYSDWNTISDEDVTPSDDIVKNAVVNDKTTDSISE